ncbi:glutamate receptor 4-like [Periplaneta americana]|uniref:glutamate receptor 4-like n=1 Tax=Periplaneta americana TaxID=6978 RepID=UPI0037E8F78F
MVTMTLVLVLVAHCGKKHENTQDGHSYPLGSAVLLIFGIFCQRGLDPAPQTWSCRLVLFTAYLSATVIFVAYSATFISFLTINRYELPFTNLKGLLDNGKYVLGMLPKSAQFTVFSTSSDPVVRGVYRELMTQPLPLTNEEGLDLMCKQNNYAFLLLTIVNKLTRPYLDCTDVEIPDYAIPVSMGMVGRKDTELKSLFNYYFVKMHEAGIVRRNEDNLLPLKFREEIKDLPSSVNIEKTLSIFIILMSGAILAVLLTILEIVIHNMKSNCLHN